MTIAGLPCPPIPGWLTQFGSGCFIREDYSVNGEVQPSVFAIFYSWQAMYRTASEAVHDSGRFGLSPGRDLEVWSLKSFGGSSTFSLRKWQVSRRLRDQYPAEDQPKSTWWRTVDAVREKKIVATVETRGQSCTLYYFFPQKTNFSYVMCRVLHLPTYFVC